MTLKIKKNILQYKDKRISHYLPILRMNIIFVPKQIDRINIIKLYPEVQSGMDKKKEFRDKSGVICANCGYTKY